tara:strand:+ start:558 stop:1370 length:813 start_codon:yes stop_codon:yes gene_type:complete
MIVVTPPRKKKSSGGHWYSISGRPVHTQPNGKNTTLRHARTQNLVPSVTTIIGQLDKPQLTKWRENNCIANSFNNPPREGEEVRDYQNRIHQNLKDDQNEILDFGTKIHKAIEDVNNGTFDSLKDPEIFPYIEPFIRWQQRRVKRVNEAEQTVVNVQYGYGGTLDLHCVLLNEKRPVAIIDYKTQNIKDKVKFYPEWSYQLAAYRKCFKPIPQCMSLVINSNEPAEPIEKVWTSDELQAGWRIFKGLCRIWQDKTNHRVKKETDASEKEE